MLNNVEALCRAGVGPLATTIEVFEDRGGLQMVIKTNEAGWVLDVGVRARASKMPDLFGDNIPSRHPVHAPLLATALAIGGAPARCAGETIRVASALDTQAMQDRASQNVHRRAAARGRALPAQAASTEDHSRGALTLTTYNIPAAIGLTNSGWSAYLSCTGHSPCGFYATLPSQAMGTIFPRRT